MRKKIKQILNEWYENAITEEIKIQITGAKEMNKIIEFNTNHKKEKLYKIINDLLKEIKTDDEELKDMLSNMAAQSIVPLNLLGIDEINIDSAGNIKTRIGSNWHEGIVSKSIYFIEPPTGEE